MGGFGEPDRGPGDGLVAATLGGEGALHRRHQVVGRIGDGGDPAGVGVFGQDQPGDVIGIGARFQRFGPARRDCELCGAEAAQIREPRGRERLCGGDERGLPLASQDDRNAHAQIRPGASGKFLGIWAERHRVPRKDVPR